MAEGLMHRNDVPKRLACMVRRGMPTNPLFESPDARTSDSSEAEILWAKIALLDDFGQKARNFATCGQSLRYLPSKAWEGKSPGVCDDPYEDQ